MKGKTSGVKTILVQNSHKGGVRPGIATQQLTSLLDLGLPGHHVSLFFFFFFAE